MVAGELARDHHQLVVVEGDVAGLAALGVDARPDHMAVLARDAVLVLLDMEDDRAGLAGQPEAVLSAVDVIEILLLAEPPLPLVGIDRQAVEIIAAPRQIVRLRLPFGERAVQVAGDGSPHLRHLHPLIVLRIKKVRGEVLPEGALAAERDHGARSIIFMSAARITVSSSQAVFKRVGSPAVIAGNAGGIIQSVADRGGAGEQLREHLFFDGRMARAARDGEVEDRAGDVGIDGKTGRLDATAELVPQVCRRAVGDRCVAFLVGLVRHLQKLGAPFARRLARSSREPRGLRGRACPGRWVPKGEAKSPLRSKPAPKRRSWCRTRKS